MFILNIGQVGGAGEAKPQKINSDPQVQKAQDMKSLDKMLSNSVSAKDVSTLSATEDAQWLFSQIDTIMVAAGASFTQRDAVKNLVNKWVPIFYTDKPLATGGFLGSFDLRQYTDEFLNGNNFPKTNGILDEFSFSEEAEAQIGKCLAEVIDHMYEKNGFYNPNDYSGVRQELDEAAGGLYANNNPEAYTDFTKAIKEFFNSEMDGISFGELERKAEAAKTAYIAYIIKKNNAMSIFNMRRVDKLMAKIKELYVT